jgi:hypothetical protein
MTHLVLSHIPPVGIAFSLLLFILGMILRTNRVQRLALFFTVLTALLTIWVYLSGPGAVTGVLAVQPDAQQQIEAHRAASQTSFVLTMGTGLICLLGLFRGNSLMRFPAWYTLMVALLLIITLALLVGTGTMGLRITRPWLDEPARIVEPTPPSQQAMEAIDSTLDTLSLPGSL